MIQLRAHCPEEAFGRFCGGERGGGRVGVGIASDIDQQFFDLGEGGCDLEGLGDACGHQGEDQNAGEVRQSSSYEIHALFSPIPYIGLGQSGL